MNNNRFIIQYQKLTKSKSPHVGLQLFIAKVQETNIQMLQKRKKQHTYTVDQMK